MHLSKPRRPHGHRPPRLSQSERRERTRGALLEAAARGLSRGGYRNFIHERVASEGGYTRGALYHLSPTRRLWRWGATAYRKANEPTRKQLNDTVFTRIDVTDGHVTGWEARPLFEELFKRTEFDYGSLAEKACCYSKRG